jgi:hypothetical protein
MIQIGKPYELVSRDIQFDPTNGYETVERYEGNKTSILSLAAAFNTNGTRTSVTHKGPLYALVARMAALNGGNDPETPVDHYEIGCEFVQEDIIMSHKLLAAANDSVVTLRTWRNQIAELLKRDPPGQLQGVVDPGEQALYNAMARGQESIETRRITLSRVRTVSSNYSAQMVPLKDEIVWTTKKLAAVFLIPSLVADRLPGSPLPAAPVGTIWGWKLRAQEARFVMGTNKVQETQSWTFAAWTIITHDIVQ